MNELYEVYPGETAEGYVGFFMPEELEHMKVAYGVMYDGADSQWINLEYFR